MLCAIAAVVAVIGAVVRATTPAPGSNPPLAPTTAASREQTRRLDTAVERLRTLQLESAELMPDEVRGVFIGLRRDELLGLRPGARPAPGGIVGHSLVQEVLPSGAVVAYLISQRLERVAQVQFLSRMTDVSRLGAHYEGLRARYGEPAGFLECPESQESAPTRRIVWIRRETTVMEAILIHSGGVGLTLAVAGNQEVASAVRRQRCRPIAREALAAWPIARSLRGERVPVSAPASP
jgi:hypothetical protein